MSLTAKFFFVALVVLTINAKFSQEPDHSFTIWDSSKNGTLFSVDLSTDDDHLSVISQNLATLKYSRSVYNFDGSLVCQAEYPLTYTYVGWPSKTNGLFFDDLNKTLMKPSSPCAQPQYLADVPEAFQDLSFTYTSKDSYLAIPFKSNKIIEYNLASGATREFNIDNATETLGGIDYSPNHDYLYAATASNDKLKAIVFDPSSGDRKRQIFAQLSFVKGNADGDGFLAADQESNILYNVDKDGNKKQIWTPSSNNQTMQAPFGICTDDMKIIALRVSGPETNVKVEIVSYDSDDGSESQAFEIKYIPEIAFTYCNDNYLSIVDKTGRVHIFKYSHSIPVWAIILIVVGSVLIVGGIVGFIIYKKKQGKKAGEYQQFSNEEKSRNGL